MPEEEKKNWLGPYIPQGNFLREMIQQVKLAYNLMLDGRVPPLLKLLPIAALTYLISPVDLIPGDLLTVIGLADDAAVMWFGMWMFFELSPPEVVREHLRRLVQRGTWQTPPSEPPDTPPEPGGEVVDGTFVVKDEQDKPQ